MRVLAVDDDPMTLMIVSGVVEAAGYECLTANDGDMAWDLLRSSGAEVVISDWRMPGMDGLELCRRIRTVTDHYTYVVLATSRSDGAQVLEGMLAGADDYLIKPLRRGELLARVQALLRRAYPSQNGAEHLQFGPYVFETRPGRLLIDGTVIDVTHKEFSLALLFFRNIGRPLSRAFIHEAVWIRDTAVPSRTMDTHVSRVRNKLRLRPENGFRLVPVYSYGYRLEKMGG